MTEQPGTKNVLFVCADNSSRSQMAEGFMRERAAKRFEAASAGTRSARLDPLAVRVMAEVGIDITEQCSKSVVEMTGERFDYVIAVGDLVREARPFFPGEKRLHWSVDDPAQVKGSEELLLEEFRRVRDEISSRVDEFLSAHDPAIGHLENKTLATM